MLGASTKNLIAFGPNRNREIRRFIGSGFGYEEDIATLNGKLCAAVNGFSLHAATAIKSSQRKRLESLCKYALRPAIAEDRLGLLENGDVSYRLKKRWSDGTSHIIYTQMEFMEKLVPIIPIRDTGGKVEKTDFRYIFHSYDSLCGPKVVRDFIKSGRVHKTFMEDKELRERKSGSDGIENYVANLYGR